MRFLLVFLFSFLPITASAYGINGKTELRCTAKDGTEYVVNGAVFPQDIELNSEWFELKEIKNTNDGIKHYKFSKMYNEKQIILDYTTKSIELSVIGKKYSCL
ncbi:TPA: hypothetical protein OOF39_000052 [Kluyvera ascorbata]|nr:hypothetical protein [Kluyvera ascorbata]